MTVKSVPVPVSEIVCGLPLASSVTLRVPVRLPVAVGLNVTAIVQVIPAGTEAPHVFVWLKSPLIEIEEMFSARLPAFFRVTDIAALDVVTSWPGNVKLVGVKTATEAVFVPVPVSVADCGLLVSTSVKTSCADSADATEGVNVTLTVHDAPAARLAPHMLEEMAKSVAAAGGVVATTAMFVIERAVELLFVNVMVCGLVVAPTSCVPKSTLAGDRATASNSGNFATNASEEPFSVV